jgi:hypothetical protein
MPGSGARTALRAHGHANDVLLALLLSDEFARQPLTIFLPIGFTGCGGESSNLFGAGAPDVLAWCRSPRQHPCLSQNALFAFLKRPTTTWRDFAPDFALKTTTQAR